MLLNKVTDLNERVCQMTFPFILGQNTNRSRLHHHSIDFSIVFSNHDKRLHLPKMSNQFGFHSERDIVHLWLVFCRREIPHPDH